MPELQPKVETGSEEVKQKFANILLQNGIKDEVKKVVITEPQLQGEHMASACEYVTIHFVEAGVKPLNLFVKKFTKNPIHTAVIKEMKCFEKESSFFNNFLPDARIFCQQRLGCENLLNFFPKSYFGNEELIVLENLATRDYFMLPKADSQDFDQAKMVLENLAKFHAVSYVMISEMGSEIFFEKYPYAGFESMCSSQVEKTMGPVFSDNLMSTIKVVKAYPVDGSDAAVTKLSEYVDSIFTLMCASVHNDPEDQLLVLNHGDCWNNNMMFYKDPITNKITDHIFLDMQITRYGSPNLDIGYFLFTSVKPQVRRKHLKVLLRIYFDTFKTTIESLNGSIEIKFEEFLKDYKKKCQLGFLVGLTVLALKAGAMKDIDIEKGLTDMDEMMEYFKNMLDTWVTNNPKKAAEISNEVVGTVEEYLNYSYL